MNMPEKKYPSNYSSQQEQKIVSKPSQIESGNRLKQQKCCCIHIYKKYAYCLMNFLEFDRIYSDMKVDRICKKNQQRQESMISQREHEVPVEHPQKHSTYFEEEVLLPEYFHPFQYSHYCQFQVVPIYAQSYTHKSINMTPQKQTILTHLQTLKSTYSQTVQRNYQQIPYARLLQIAHKCRQKQNKAFKKNWKNQLYRFVCCYGGNDTNDGDFDFYFRQEIEKECLKVQRKKKKSERKDKGIQKSQQQERQDRFEQSSKETQFMDMSPEKEEHIEHINSRKRKQVNITALINQIKVQACENNSTPQQKSEQIDVQSVKQQKPKIDNPLEEQIQEFDEQQKREKEENKQLKHEDIVKDLVDQINYEGSSKFVGNRQRRKKGAKSSSVLQTHHKIEIDQSNEIQINMGNGQEFVNDIKIQKHEATADQLNQGEKIKIKEGYRSEIINGQKLQNNKMHSNRYDEVELEIQEEKQGEEEAVVPNHRNRRRRKNLVVTHSSVDS